MNPRMRSCVLAIAACCWRASPAPPTRRTAWCRCATRSSVSTRSAGPRASAPASTTAAGWRAARTCRRRPPRGALARRRPHRSRRARRAGQAEHGALARQEPARHRLRPRLHGRAGPERREMELRLLPGVAGHALLRVPLGGRRDDAAQAVRGRHPQLRDGHQQLRLHRRLGRERRRRPTCVAPQRLRFRAAVWGPSGQLVRELKPLPGSGDTTTAATAINDRGQVVGISGICDQAAGRFSAIHAVLWQPNGAGRGPRRLRRRRLEHAEHDQPARRHRRLRERVGARRRQPELPRRS